MPTGTLTLPGMEAARPYIQESIYSRIDETRQTYLQQVPRDRATVNTLLIGLHGHGSHQEQLMTPGIYHNALGRMMEIAWQRNVLYVTPEYRGNSWMNAAAEADITQLIATLRTMYRLTRVVLIGGSMGGTSALIYAALRPAMVDGVIAACPATDMELAYHEFRQGPLPEIADAIRASYGSAPDDHDGEFHRRSTRRHATLLSMPITLLHGDADALIDIEHSRALDRRLRAIGAPVTYTEIPGGDHDAPVQLMPDALNAMLDRLGIQWEGEE
jgi:pimeloyl-ACP methyl ester carboxylesterase